MHETDPGKTATDAPTTAVPASAFGMAASFTASMAEWAASGFKTVSQARHDARVNACSSCSYHEAPRCTLCGCFTEKKAWLPHEDCPLGKWPG